VDAVTLSRLQFGMTIVYHYFFVPLTLGLILMIAIMETLYVRTNNAVYKRMAQFWSKLFLINFAMGVVTGIVEEFQFGMNWSAFSRFTGDVIGAPLAIETLAAFFLESTFLGIWLFGWDRLSKKVHLAVIWVTVLGSYLSAFWILVANSFMQHPVGYKIVNGQAEMTNFWSLLGNPHLWYQFPHVALAGVATGAFFVIGVSAYHFLRKTTEQDFFQRSMKIALIVALISSIGTAIAGDQYGKYDVQTQPMKMSAAEALWNTAQPAPWSLFSISDQQAHKTIVDISVPYVLSFMSYNNFTSAVEGINQLQAQYVQEYGPGNYIPDVNLMFYSFRAMIAVAGLLVLVSAAGLFLIRMKKLYNNRIALIAMFFSLFLPYVGNTFGWVLGEMGRQPWVVYGLLQTANANSPSVSTGEIILTLIIFAILYIILGVTDAYLLARYVKKGVDPVEGQEQKQEEHLAVSY
jgi:cytochrome d ubiquinol oxidase subunit I